MTTIKLTSVGLLLIFLSWAAPLFAQNELKEQMTVPLTDPGKPGFLAVNLLHGSIRVVGYSGKDIVIDAASDSRRSSKDDSREGSDPNARGMKRIPKGNPLQLSAEEKDNHVQVHSTYWASPVDLTIKVPQRCSLKLNTVSDGEIVVENVAGNLEVTNVNGAITLTNVTGSAVANTVNGDLKATFKSIDSGTPMAFSTLNGALDVTFPANAKANVKLKSDMGDIYSDFDIDVDKSQPRVDRKSQPGMYKVSVDDWVQGKINGGGPEMMMKNMQGNIYIRKAK